MDSDFTITYEEGPASPHQDREEEVRGTESVIGSAAAPAETDRPEEGE